MIQLQQCPNHMKPLEIIALRQGGCAALCEKCFETEAMPMQEKEGVRINSHTLNLFNMFTTYVINKLHQWIQSIIHQSGGDAVFEKVVQNENGNMHRSEDERLKKIQIQVIEDYCNLIKNNRDCVMSNMSVAMLYHPQFLKDMFNLVLVHWRISGIMIGNNFNGALLHYFPNKKNPEYRVKPNLIQEIDLERLKMINEVSSLVIMKSQFRKVVQLIKMQPIKQAMIAKANTNQSDRVICRAEVNQVSDFQLSDAPFCIKKVNSFIQIKQKLESESLINQQGHLQQKRQQNAHLVGNVESSQLSEKYKKLIQQLLSTKLQNQNLIQENSSLKNQNASLNQEILNLRKKYEKVINASRKNLTRKGSQKFDSNTQLFQELVELQAQINDCNHDIGILIDYINTLTRYSAIQKLNFSKKLHELRTIHFSS